MNHRLIAILFALAAAAQARTVIVSPAGTTNGVGTKADPFSLMAAIAAIAPGDTILALGGKYPFVDQITIDSSNCGVSGSLKHLFAAAGEVPVFDFSGQTFVYPPAGGANPRGIQINGNWWHLRGISVTKAADNGIYVAGKNNVVEACATFGNFDTGLQLGRASSSQSSLSQWPSDNLILNCESYDNYDDPAKQVGGKGGAGENADGFAAKLTVGEGNVFRGCVSHHNIDDGWDLFTKVETGAIGTVTIDQCVAHHNGSLTNGTASANGDRNGFKLGGSDMANRHVVTRSVSYANGKDGFTWNSNPGEILVSNTLAFDNADANYKFGDAATPTKAEFRNNLSFFTGAGVAVTDKHVGLDVDNSNCWWDKSKKQQSINAAGLIVSAADFAADLSLYTLAKTTVARKPNGSLDLSVFGLAVGSDLLDAGTVPPATHRGFEVGYYQGSPDLGAFETGGTSGSLVRTFEQGGIHRQGGDLLVRTGAGARVRIEIVDVRGATHRVLVASPRAGVARAAGALSGLGAGVWYARVLQVGASPAMAAISLP